MDRQFADARLAQWYDDFCGWEGRGDLDFYLPMVMRARAVLDVGCGTGMLLRRARAAGHRGRLCGLDPAAAMLDVARRGHDDIEWVCGDLSGAGWDREFDLVVMTGHAFQVLVTDREVRSGLAKVGRALTDEGRFGFETRNPGARAWAEWTPERGVEVGRDGTTVRMEHRVDSATGGVVRFSATYTSPGWAGPVVSWSTLRFLERGELAGFLDGAGLVVEEQFGDWDRGPVTATGPEIITIARRGS